MWSAIDSGIGQVPSPVLPLVIYLSIALIVILETGVIFGFFLPGDLLLIAAGVIAGGYTDIDLRLVIVTCVAASIIGSQLGYFIGMKFGRVLEKNKNSPSIENELKMSHKYFAKNQVLSVFLSNFIPGMRIFIPMVAGNQKMNRFKFISANVTGSVAWAGIFTSLGYALSNIANVRENPLIVFAAVFLLASFLSIVNFFRSL